MGQALAAPGRRQRRLAQLLALGGVVGRTQHDVERADHHSQQIVEVVRHAPGQAADGLHALGVHQIGLGLGLFGQGCSDPLLKQFVDPLQILLGALGVGDVEVGADIALERATCVEAGDALAAKPACAETRMLHLHGALVSVLRLHGAFEGRVIAFQVQR